VARLSLPEFDNLNRHAPYVVLSITHHWNC
jgi:hypothetical protein